MSIDFKEIAEEMSGLVDDFLEGDDKADLVEFLWDNKIGILRGLQALAAQQDGAESVGASAQWLAAEVLRVTWAKQVTERFKVVAGSQSAHCCFEATVVDTQVPVMVNGERYEGQYEPICECFDAADAERIAAAMNIGR